MLTYSFTDTGSEPMYEYLYKCMKKDIIKGVLPPGDRLPSKRTFAKNLGISIITIENAYAQLMAEGYIYSLPKKGYFVADIKESMPEGKKNLTMENVNLSGGQTSYLADFASNQTDPDNFPFSIWARMIREILNQNRTDLMTNPPCGGILYLRQAIATHLKEFRGMVVSPEQIIVGAGTEYLYGLLIQLLGFDKKYAVENPGYQKVMQIYKSNRVSCSYVDMDESGMQTSELEKSGADIVHLTPAHHFPTGITMPIARRYELLAWASSSESRYIIEDDYDSEFRLTGRPIPTLQSIDVMEKVIYINTFTKSLASTVRIGYMVLPGHLVNQFYANMNFYSCTVSNFEQYTLARFISDGSFEKHINRMRSFYCTKRDHLLQIIRSSPLNSLVTISEEDAGLHFLMNIRTRLTDGELIRSARQEGINLSSLSQYYIDAEEPPAHTFVINYSFVKEEVMEEAVLRLYQILRKSDKINQKE